MSAAAVHGTFGAKNGGFKNFCCDSDYAALPNEHQQIIMA